MRRLAAVAAVGIATLASVSTASAQFSQTFSSPSRAVAGAPMFVRSVTPCPATFGYVIVEILAQLGDAPGDSTQADVAHDGSWVLTVSAPSDMAAGVTKSYLVTVRCSDGGVDYGTRRLYVTGLGGEAAASTATDSGAVSAAAAEPVSVPTVNALVSSPRADVVKRDSLTAQAVESQSVDAPAESEPTTTWVSDEAERAAEARAELARQTSGADRDVTLSALPVVASSDRPEPDGGIPWWSFVAATMLAVGAVIGYGERRRTSLTTR